VTEGKASPPELYSNGVASHIKDFIFRENEIKPSARLIWENWAKISTTI
jgi:hypothetical protein